MTVTFTVPKPDTLFTAVLWNAVKRSPGQLHPDPHGTVLNLGAGNALLLNQRGDDADELINLDRPNWEAPDLNGYVIEGEVATVHMHHFLEHLDPDTAFAQLKEIERVLMPGGTCYITVPHAMSSLAYQAPDHKSFWTEEGLQDTFYSAGYDSSYGAGWKMDITWMMVGGIKFHNLCVMAQLKKQIDGKPYETPWRRDG